MHEVLRRALEFGFLKAEDVAAAVFDEAHHAIGNHPYVAIASALPERTRVVGLTASAGPGRHPASLQEN